MLGRLRTFTQLSFCFLRNTTARDLVSSDLSGLAQLAGAALWGSGRLESSWSLWWWTGWARRNFAKAICGANSPSLEFSQSCRDAALWGNAISYCSHVFLPPSDVLRGSFLPVVEHAHGFVFCPCQGFAGHTLRPLGVQQPAQCLCRRRAVDRPVFEDVAGV